MAYPPISPLPTPPSRSQSPDTFSTDADAFLGALPGLQSETNALASYLDDIGAAVDADAALASVAADIALGAANYRGDYNAGTTYQIGQSVTYSGKQYVAKTVNTGVTPVSGANWYEVIRGDVVGPASATNNALALFSGTTGKIVKNSSVTSTGSDLSVPGGINAQGTSTIEKAVLNNGYTEEVFTITDGTTVNLDPNNGSIQTWTLGASRTPGQANWAAGQSITLMIDDGTAYSITWTTLAVTWKTDGGTAPILATSGYTVIALWKVGTTIYGARVGDA